MRVLLGAALITASAAAGALAVLTPASVRAVAPPLSATATADGWPCPGRSAFEVSFTPVTDSSILELEFSVTLEWTGGEPLSPSNSPSLYWNPGFGTTPEPIDVRFSDIPDAAAAADPKIVVRYQSPNISPPIPSTVLVEQSVTLDTSLSFTAGDGSRANPYQVSTVDHLRDIGCTSFDHVALTTDLDLTGVDLAPIGAPFGMLSVNVDGRGHTISNLTMSRAGEHEVGLFSSLRNAKVRNLTIDNATVIGEEYVGVLVGDAVTRNRFHRIDITNSRVTGQKYLGLVTGSSERSMWTSIDVDGAVTSVYSAAFDERDYAYHENIGGLFGEFRESRLEDATVDVSVTGEPVASYFNIGGLAGDPGDMAMFENITGTTQVDVTAGEIRWVGGVTGDRLNDGGYLQSSRLTTSVVVNSRNGDNAFIERIGGAFGGMDDPIVRASEITGTVTVNPAPGITVDRVGGLTGDTTNDFGQIVQSRIDVDVVVNGAASRVGSLVGNAESLIADDMMIDGTVTVTGDGTRVGGLIGYLQANSQGPYISLQNVIWRGTRSVGSYLTPADRRSLLWGEITMPTDYPFGALFSSGVFWQSATDTTPDPWVGDPATAAELATKSFLDAAEYDTARIWCVTATGPVLRVLDAVACATGDDPSAPTTPTVVQRGSGARLTVSPPTSQPAITRYEYSFSDDGGQRWTSWAPLAVAVPGAQPTDPIQLDIDELSPCVTYRFKVRAVNSVGAGAESAASAELVMTLPLPGAPTNVTASRKSSGSVLLAWTAPTTNPTPSSARSGGSSDHGNAGASCPPVSRYEYRSSSNGGASWSGWTAARSTTTQTVVSGLSRSKTYVFQVRAVNATGAGAASNSTAPVRPN